MSAPSAAFLVHARTSFRTFYARASVDETRMMDGLIVLHRALLAGISTPRRELAGAVCDDVERTTDAVEHGYMMFRDAVRTCPTFRTLGRTDREHIERELLLSSMPWIAGEATGAHR